MNNVKQICLDPEQFIKAVNSLNKINVPWANVESAAAAKAALETAQEYTISIPESSNHDPQK